MPSPTSSSTNPFDIGFDTATSDFIIACRCLSIWEPFRTPSPPSTSRHAAVAVATSATAAATPAPASSSSRQASLAATAVGTAEPLAATTSPTTFRDTRSGQKGQPHRRSILALHPLPIPQAQPSQRKRHHHHFPVVFFTHFTHYRTRVSASNTGSTS